jgi:hypothetical protein
MGEEPRLSEAEWALIIDLLERERADLPVQMHESRSFTEREELRVRSEAIRKLIGRVQSLASV